MDQRDRQAHARWVVTNARIGYSSDFRNYSCTKQQRMEYLLYKRGPFTEVNSFQEYPRNGRLSTDDMTGQRKIGGNGVQVTV